MALTPLPPPAPKALLRQRYPSRDLVEKNPSPQAFVMLGDAYMSIQEVGPTDPLCPSPFPCSSSSF